MAPKKGLFSKHHKFNSWHSPPREYIPVRGTGVGKGKRHFGVLKFVVFGEGNFEFFWFFFCEAPSPEDGHLMLLEGLIQWA